MWMIEWVYVYTLLWLRDAFINKNKRGFTNKRQISQNEQRVSKSHTKMFNISSNQWNAN